MPEPEKPESVPPETVTSPTAKLVDASESVKVMVAVLPALRELTLLEMAIVGGVVSAATTAVPETVKFKSLESAVPFLISEPLEYVLLPVPRQYNPLLVVD